MKFNFKLCHALLYSLKGWGINTSPIKIFERDYNEDYIDSNEINSVNSNIIVCIDPIIADWRVEIIGYAQFTGYGYFSTCSKFYATSGNKIGNFGVQDC